MGLMRLIKKRTKDKEKFTVEETICINDDPYFPVKKVAKLLGVDLNYIDDLVDNHDEIFKHIVGVKDNNSGKYVTYISPEGCLLVAMNCDSRKVGENLHIGIATVMDYILKGKTEKIKEYIAAKGTHPFIKAFFGWDNEAFKLEKAWDNLPVQ